MVDVLQYFVQCLFFLRTVAGPLKTNYKRASCYIPRMAKNINAFGLVAITSLLMVQERSNSQENKGHFIMLTKMWFISCWNSSREGGCDWDFSREGGDQGNWFLVHPLQKFIIPLLFTLFLKHLTKSDRCKLLYHP